MKEKITTDGQKKTWSNYYWYYYKWHIFFVIFFGIGIAICTVQCATKIDPDCYILFNSNTYISDQQLNETADKLEGYILDLNDDDKTEIIAINCTYPAGNQTQKTRVNQQAVLQMQDEKTCIWVVDQKGIELYLQNDSIDIFATYDKFDSFDGMAVSVEKIPALKWLNDNNAEKEFYLIARKGTDQKILPAAKTIIDKIME